jgi:hypothetical protein
VRLFNQHVLESAAHFWKDALHGFWIPACTGMTCIIENFDGRNGTIPLRPSTLGYFLK